MAKKLIDRSNVVCCCLLCVVSLWQANAGLLDPISIGNELQKFARDALGTDEMQVYFNGLQYHKQTLNGEDVTTQLAIKLADKFKARFEVTKRLKKAVEASYARRGIGSTAQAAKECCKADKSKLKYNENFRFRVDLDNMCVKISGTAPPNPVHLDEGVFREMKEISRLYPFIKWQYFASDEGVLTNFPVYYDKDECSEYDPRYRPYYVETATPEAKDVVLVIDTSASMVGKKMYIAKEAAKTVLDTMNPKDQVGIVSFSNDISTPGDNGAKSTCYGQKLALAIPANIRILKDYVTGLNPHGKTHYKPAFQKAFSLLKASMIDDETAKPKKRVILFLTDGAPSDDEQRRPIFQTIRDMNLQLNNSVIILTFGFGSVDENTREILQDIAEQNTARYNVSVNSSVGDITPGIFTPVPDMSTLRSKMATYYTLFSSIQQLTQPVVSVPYVDAFGTGLLVSITLPCYHNGRFIGVTGTDINIDDLAADISLFQNQGHGAYAFMTNKPGRTMVHPLLPTPSGAYDDPVYLDIRALEPEPEFNEVFNAISSKKTGSKTILSKRFLPRGETEKDGVTVRNVNSTYHWTQLEGTEFSLGVVVPVSQAKDELNTLQIPKGYTFNYHRIDLDPPQKPCSHFGLLCDKDKTTIKFAPDAFSDPYDYIGKEETKADVDLFKAYMTDKTGTVPNPGLRPGIRDTVIATWKVEDLWLRDKSELTQYLVWRYIGTSNGVFRIAPGTASEKGYDHRKRPWYYTALANTGSISLTTPYLDATGSQSPGAGVVITAARAIFLGEPRYIHQTNDDVLGVMGADFSLTYFHRLLTKVYPECEDRKTYSCFVMNDAGFLIMHEDFLLSTATAADVEHVHITEKEKSIAEHLINRGYLRKKQCRNLKEIRKQSFYEVKLPNGFVDEIKNVDSCSKYQLSKIMGTNAYLGVAVRDAMFCVAESCSCSSDRKCSYLSPKCECPCTSPMQFNYCLSQFPLSSLPICPPSVPQAFVPSYFQSSVRRNECDNQRSGLAKCFDPHCSAKNSSVTCEGIVSCHWCQYDKDNVPLKKRYCASSSVCFRGKEAKQRSNCDYTIGTNTESSTEKNRLEISAGAIAAILIGCMALVVVMAIAGFIMVKRQRRTSGRASTLKNQNPKNRPPAPLPEPLPDPPDAERIYHEPEIEPSRRGSVDSLEWHSNDRQPNITLEQTQQSSRPGKVIPRPPGPSHAINTRERSLRDTQLLPLSQERKTSLINIPSYESLPRSATEVAMPTVANTTSATESRQQHSTETTMNCDDCKLESAALSALSQDQDINSAYTPKTRVHNESYAKDTIWTCDKSASVVSADTTNHSPYDNQPPPIPPRRQKTAESDAYMIPCTRAPGSNGIPLDTASYDNGNKDRRLSSGGIAGIVVGCTVPAIVIVIITVVLRKKRTAPRQINCPVRQPAAVPQPSHITLSNVTMKPTNFRDAPPSYEAAIGGPQPSAPPFNPYYK